MISAGNIYKAKVEIFGVIIKIKKEKKKRTYIYLYIYKFRNLLLIHRNVKNVKTDFFFICDIATR